MARKNGITRDQYKSIKRMDHKQMEKFMVDLYTEGFDDGKEAAGKKRIRASDIAVAIMDVKGIGTKKATEIMAAINKLYEGGRNEPEEEKEAV